MLPLTWRVGGAGDCLSPRCRRRWAFRAEAPAQHVPRARSRGCPGSPWRKSPLHSSGDASRLTALFVGYICPICALLTPCHVGASPLSVQRGVSPRAAEDCRASQAPDPAASPVARMLRDPLRADVGGALRVQGAEPPRRTRSRRRVSTRIPRARGDARRCHRRRRAPAGAETSTDNAWGGCVSGIRDPTNDATRVCAGHGADSRQARLGCNRSRR